MRASRTTRSSIALALFALVLAGCTSNSATTQSGAPQASTGDYTTRTVTDGTTEFTIVDNPGGSTLSYSTAGGMTLLEEDVDGKKLAFKDMNANGALDPWEDWRLDSQVRADSLVESLTTEEISGLMLFSPHQFAPADGLTDTQKGFLSNGHVRSITDAGDNHIENNVTWVNEMQAYVETLQLEGGGYIPAFFSSDPRSNARGGYTITYEGGAFAKAGTGEFISQWPENLGLAATFDPELVKKATTMQAEEYRALGINSALGPQIDLVTDPRWLRNGSTFGEDVDMASAMAAAYVDGMQEVADVQTTMKHFPGDGSGEGGRESHSEQGKYAVYPTDNQDEAISVFETAMSSAAVMVSYSASVSSTGGPVFGENSWATAFNKPTIDVLRDAGYEGVVITDWFVTALPGRNYAPDGRLYGIYEDWDVNEQHYRVLHAGVDMFGGNDDTAPLLEAYKRWDEAFAAGEESVDAKTRWAQTGTRVLNQIIASGAFENPFVDLEHSQAVAGNEEKMAAGIEAQLASVVMLKNQDSFVAAKNAGAFADQTVYIPNSWSQSFSWQTQETSLVEGPTLSAELAGTYFKNVVTDTATLNAEGNAVESYSSPDLTDVDVVIVRMSTPRHDGGLNSDGEYIPVSLQYRPYTADGPNVRKTSISGDILPDGSKENRSYFGRTGTAANAADLDAFERAVTAVKASGKDIPIIVILDASGPSTVIPTEFEAEADVILMGYGVAQQAYFEVALGQYEPKGRLPLGLPDSMDSVEASSEDVTKDHGTYVDGAGNAYAYGFGLNYSGPISK